jgi:hypothetical protein
MSKNLAIRRPPARWKPFLGDAKIKGFPAQTVGLSALGAIAAYGIDKMLNVPADQIRAEQSSQRFNDYVAHVLPAFGVTTLVAGTTWWLSGSKTPAFVIEAVGLMYFIPKTIALFGG